MYIRIDVSIRNSILDSEDTSRFRFYGNTLYQVKRSVDNVICIYTAEIQAYIRKKILGERQIWESSSYWEFLKNRPRENVRSKR